MRTILTRYARFGMALCGIVLFLPLARSIVQARCFFSLVSVVWPHFETRQDSSELEFGIKQGGDQETFDKMREAFEYLDDRQSREQSSDRLNLKSACCGTFAEGSKIVEVG